MTQKRSTANTRAWQRAVLVIGLVLVATPSSGCARSRFGWLSPWSQKRTDASWPTAATPTTNADRHANTDAATPTDEPMLSAVEEFLRRTEQYEVAAMAEPQPDDEPGAAPPADEHDASPVVNAPPTAAGDSANASVAQSDDGLGPMNSTPTNRVPQPVLAIPVLAIPVLESISVRASEPDDDAVENPVAGTANQPLDMRLPAPVVAGAEFMDELLEQATREASLASWWRAGLASVAVDRQFSPDTSASTTDDIDMAVYRATLDAVRSARRVTLDPTLPAHDAVRSAQRLLAAVSQRADPIVPLVTLCRKVATFGVYDEILPDALMAGRPIHAIVYCEIENLRSDQTTEGRFRTVLATRIEVLSVAGESVWLHEEPEIVDLCRRRRGDFFVAQKINLPPTLRPGDYVLKIMVEDKLSGRVAEGMLELSITSPTSVAASGLP